MPILPSTSKYCYSIQFHFLTTVLKKSYRLKIVFCKLHQVGEKFSTYKCSKEATDVTVLFSIGDTVKICKPCW